MKKNISLKQLDLFEDDYMTLEELKSYIESFHHTGSYDKEYNEAFEKYNLDFYRDLAFIVQYREDTEGDEKIIDNACYLVRVENDLYKIYKIDGKTIGSIDKDFCDDFSRQLKLIEFINNGRLFRRVK